MPTSLIVTTDFTIRIGVRTGKRPRDPDVDIQHYQLLATRKGVPNTAIWNAFGRVSLLKLLKIRASVGE